MTYKSLIENQLFAEIREKRSWPSDDANALADQLRIVYGACLVLGKELPKSVFFGLAKESTLAENSWYPYPNFTLPEDVFFVRDDLGVISMTVDQEQRFTPEETVTFQTIRESSDNPFQSGNVLIHFDRSERKVFLLNGYEIQLSYIPLFTEPTADNYATLDVPVPVGYRDQLVQLVAMHVEAVRNGNASKSQVHGVLAELYD